MKKTKILSAFLSMTLGLTSFASVPMTASAEETVTTTAPTTYVQTTTTAASGIMAYYQAKVKISFIDNHTYIPVEGLDVTVLDSSGNEVLSFNTTETPEIITDISYRASTVTSAYYTVKVSGIPEQYKQKDTFNIYFSPINDGTIVNDTIRLEYTSDTGYSDPYRTDDPTFCFKNPVFFRDTGDNIVIPFSNTDNVEVSASIESQNIEIVSVNTKNVILKASESGKGVLTVESENGKKITANISISSNVHYVTGTRTTAKPVTTTTTTTTTAAKTTTLPSRKLISDLDTIRSLFTERFKSNGYSAVCAEDGKYPEFAGKVVIENYLDGDKPDSGIYDFAIQNNINMNCFQYLPMGDGVPLTGTTTVPGQTVTQTTATTAEKMDITIPDGQIIVRVGEVKDFEYILSGTENITCYEQGKTNAKVKMVTQDGKNYFRVDASNAYSDMDYIEVILGTSPNTTVKYIYFDVLPPEFFHCTSCDRDVPWEERVSGPLGIEVCRECYETKHIYLGTTTAPDITPVTTTTTATGKNGEILDENGNVLIVNGTSAVMSQPISTTAPNPVTTTTTTTEPIEGDANCDGQLNMADAVMIMQYIATPDKYGLNGTSERHITDQGMKNADITGDNDGVTNADALAIQKKLLNL